MINYFPKAIAIMTLSCAVSPAFASSALELSSDVYVESIKTQADGSSKAVLNKPTTVLPGDKLVFVVKYTNTSAAPASNLLVTNPLPAPVIYNGSADGKEEVSVDGGKNWGPLNTLFVEKTDGTNRPALMSDVTHVRWTIKDTLAAGSSGKLIFRGIVR